MNTNTMKRCSNGHFFDESKFSTCPFCKTGADSTQMGARWGAPAAPASNDIGTTVPGSVGLGVDAVTRMSSEIPRTMPANPGSVPVDLGRQDDIPPTSPVYDNVPGDYGITTIVQRTSGEGDQQQTVSGPLLTVGWLIITKGSSIGQDFRLHAGTNTIGRDGHMDVVIRDDPSVSQEMAYIQFDNYEGKQSFILVAGVGKNAIRLNGTLLPVRQFAVLKAYDHILFGNTEMVFVPLCGESFAW